MESSNGNNKSFTYNAGLKEVKSSYILKKIFSNLNKKKELYMIIYNKKFQNLLNINLDDYKNMRGRYKIVGKNGLGKEFLLDKDILIFEGEYLNNKRYGKGKEYNNGKLKFEGE